MIDSLLLIFLLAQAYSAIENSFSVSGMKNKLNHIYSFS
jgi:hypothetical protein